MKDGNENRDGGEKKKVIVEAEDIGGIVSALGLELVEQPQMEEQTSYPDEPVVVLETLADIFKGVQVGTENESRGRSRKMVRQYADREDLSSDEVGHLLRVLEGHNIVVQDGNRWRIAESISE